MSRLDRHIGFVRNKLALERLFHGLAWSVTALAAVVLLAILVNRLFHLSPPRPQLWLLAGSIAALLAGVIYALYRRPTPHEAAVAIDARLGLKEKFSTALYARSSADPFAQAAVKDAEHTAENVSLHKRFPLSFPRSAYPALIAVASALAATLLPEMDLFGKQAEENRQAEAKRQQDSAQRAVKDALVAINNIPKAAADEKVIEEAKRDLERLLTQPTIEPDRARRTVADKLESVEQSMRQQIQKSEQFAQAQQNKAILQNLKAPPDDKSPAGRAQIDMMKGDFVSAAEELKTLAEKFEKMEQKEQEKAKQQMQQLAQQLQQAANNPQVQQQMQQQLQQLGATQQQAQQMVQNMQQAAQGNQQAAQQLQQQAQQMMQQMNNGQGPNQQQQQAIQQAMQQMQGQANSQAQAQQLSQAAQQMAQAMQQMQQAQQNQAGQQQAGNNPQNAQQQQQMAAAQQQLQQQLQQMGATQQNMQQMQAMQQAMQQAAAAQAGACNNPGGQNPGNQPGGQGQQGNQGQQANGQQGQWQQGNNQQQQGFAQGGGPGQAIGPRDVSAGAPHSFKAEQANAQDLEEGQVLAAHLVNTQAKKGESRLKAAEFKKATESEVTDEVEQENVPRPVREAVKNYFDFNK